MTMMMTVMVGGLDRDLTIRGETIRGRNDNESHKDDGNHNDGTILDWTCSIPESPCRPLGENIHFFLNQQHKHYNHNIHHQQSHIHSCILHYENIKERPNRGHQLVAGNHYTAAQQPTNQQSLPSRLFLLVPKSIVAAVSVVFVAKSLCCLACTTTKRRKHQGFNSSVEPSLDTIYWLGTELGHACNSSLLVLS